jgi:hypothetical protein
MNIHPRVGEFITVLFPFVLDNPLSSIFRAAVCWPCLLSGRVGLAWSWGSSSSPDCFTTPLVLPTTSIIGGRGSDQQQPPFEAPLLLRCGLCLVGQPLSPQALRTSGIHHPFAFFHATNWLPLPRSRHPGLFPQTHGFAPHQITSEIPGLAQLPVLSAPLPAHPSETAKRPTPLPSPWTPKPYKPPRL